MATLVDDDDPTRCSPPPSSASRGKGPDVTRREGRTILDVTGRVEGDILLPSPKGARTWSFPTASQFST
jgi:hypothetical protein